MKKKGKYLFGKRSIISLICVVAILCSFMPSMADRTFAESSEQENKILINEVESNDANGGNDWIEIINTGDVAVNIGGWYVTDDDGVKRFTKGKTTPLAADTVLNPGEVLVFEQNTDFKFGLGDKDSAILYDSEGNQMDSYSWTSHANGTYQRMDSGVFEDKEPTKGAVNTTGSIDAVNTLVLNEINSSPDDWVEVMNTGTSALDISGYEIRDNSDDHRYKFPDGTSVGAGELLLVKADSMGLIFDDSTDSYKQGAFDEAIGIGSGDSIRLYNSEGTLIDSFSWTEHANRNGDQTASWGRYPDGTGDFVIMPETAGALNECYPSAVVINEIQSNDPNGGSDWIELANPTNEAIDISGIVIKDEKDSHSYTIPEGTTIAANGFIVFTEKDFGFGLGKGDSVRLFENGTLIASVTWADHTNPTWGLYPDVNGSEYRNTLEETPGAANKFAVADNVIDWPGSDEVKASELTFLEDSSGLDFYNGQLYAVDNGTGKYWILDVADDGTLSFAKGFENGKTVNFTTPSANGPDTEGITVDAQGYVYLASERDNSNKGVNYNVILKTDPNAEGDSQIALQQWDLTDSLPSVTANAGIEAVEWVANEDVENKLMDANTNALFDSSNYPDAVAGGVFFVALEDNGHVYAYVLNSDGTSVQIADIDSQLGGAMALDYDTYEDKLWVATDNGYANMMAQITFNGTDTLGVVHVNPASGVDKTANNEGFAIAEVKYTVNGQRPVYRFADGVTSGALTIGSLNCTVKENSTQDGDDDTAKADNNTTNNSNEEDTLSAKIKSSEDSIESAVAEQKVIDNSSDTEAIKTGDQSSMEACMIIMIASALATLMGLFIRKKKC